jgi:hypothetical protein
MFGYDVVTRAIDRSAILGPPPSASEIVTITNPLIIEKRPVVAPPQSVAPDRSAPAPFVRPPAGFGFPRSRPDVAEHRTPAQLAFSQALEHNRQVALAALNASRDPARVPEKYRLSMEGKRAKLKRGQGIYFPTRGWRENGLDFYDVSYEFVYPNGDDEKGQVPWPIHFDPATDPFFSPDFDALARTPMPGPPAGYTPPGDLGKALRAYFPNLHFEDSDN